VSLSAAPLFREMELEQVRIEAEKKRVRKELFNARCKIKFP
jgi:hypothetical protein